MVNFSISKQLWKSFCFSQSLANGLRNRDQETTNTDWYNDNNVKSNDYRIYLCNTIFDGVCELFGDNHDITHWNSECDNEPFRIGK